MNRHKIMTRAQRRERQAVSNAARIRWVRLGALAAKGVIRRPHYVHEQDLSAVAREEISEAIADMTRIMGEVPRDGCSDITTAYHAEFLLSAAWMLFSATECPELGAVLQRHGIDVHPEWWLTDGWGEYREKHGVRCGQCNGFTFGMPNGIYAAPRDIDWPSRCECGAALPVQHRTDVFGTPEASYAECCCGWETDKPSARRYARGAATRHVNSKRAAVLVAA